MKLLSRQLITNQFAHHIRIGTSLHSSRMRSTSDENFSRVIVSITSLFIIFGFHKFVSTNAAPVDFIMFSPKRNQDLSSTSYKSADNSEIHDDGISYRLDAWSQYDNPEEGVEREGDIHEFPETRKTTTRDQNLLWPKGVVPFWLHSSIRNEPKELAILKEAMQTIMDKSCVVFEEIFPNETGKFPQSSWVNITGNQKGCFSDLGRSKFRPTNLNLKIGKCFRTKGHAMHEILHTLGVYHEHMRPDRDEHIKILWNNIKDGDAFNFRLMPNSKVTTYGLPYDYDSIMHYSMTAFAKNKSRASIVPMKQVAVIGQRDHLSEYDIEKLLITYKCNDKDSSVAKNTANFNNSVKGFEHKEIKLRSFTESDVQNDNYDDDDETLETFSNDKISGSWSVMDLLNYPHCDIFPLYVDYLNYFG